MEFRTLPIYLSASTSVRCKMCEMAWKQESYFFHWPLHTVSLFALLIKGFFLHHCINKLACFYAEMVGHLAKTHTNKKRMWKYTSFNWNIEWWTFQFGFFFCFFFFGMKPFRKIHLFCTWRWIRNYEHKNHYYRAQFKYSKWIEKAKEKDRANYRLLHNILKKLKVMWCNVRCAISSNDMKFQIWTISL